jgi:hypothetical protein
MSASGLVGQSQVVLRCWNRDHAARNLPDGVFVIDLPVRLTVALLVFVFAASTGLAGTHDGRLTVKLAPVVYHYSSDPDHNNQPRLVGLEWERSDLWNMGGVHFRNSFDQPSQYLYVGRRWFPDALPSPVYLKLTGGVMLGYKDPYDDKIPLNHRRGVAPAILPAAGYQLERMRVQLVPLGTAGLMVTFGFHI